MKNIFLLPLAVVLFSCSQDPSRVAYRESGAGIGKVNSLKPSYMKGDYVRTKDNKVVRDLNGISDKSYADGDGDSNGSDNSTLGSPSTQDFRVMVVQSGDSLLKIANAHSLTVGEIARFNKIEPPYNIYTGQKIKIPTNRWSSRTQESRGSFYTVRPGDNLYRIAFKNNVNFTDLVRNNSLKKPYDVYIGQKLFIGTKKSGEEQTSVPEEKAAMDGQGLERVDGGKKTTVITVGDGVSDRVNGSFIWPVEGKIIKNFGKQPNGNSNDSVSIEAPQGTKIKSIAGGEVAYAGDELKGFGRIIILKYDGGWISVYGHCESVTVKVKDMVQKGQIIGTVGETGNVSEPQLYFSLRKGRIAVDPIKYLPGR
ncbi:MAG: M23 family metallopeptidase [Rickettsiales bacterium]|jgi:murein DD-endopeptidase MepM/ murein hydrolase activator NlpD|nr:M23 family metallopeptidase [Rickettsiales bacterium]